MNENENLQPVQKLTPFTKMVMSIGTLPSSFYASMSYYESMVWLYEYLKNEVIPTVNGNAEAVEELQEAYTTLKNYIDTYFDNLDVQEEVNKKLDEMATDGSLTNLIKGYVDPIFESYEDAINQTIDDQNSTISNFTSSINETVGIINTKVDQATSGSPLVASSTAGMTDTSRIYVNTTDGNWYYYDGDSWEIGGVYQASVDSDDVSLLKYTDNMISEDTVNVIDMSKFLEASGWEVDENGVAKGTISNLASAFNTANTFYNFNGTDTKFYFKCTARNLGDTTTGRGLTVVFNYTDSTYSGNSLDNDKTTWTDLTITSKTVDTAPLSVMYFTYGSGGSNIWEIKNCILVVGSKDTVSYIPHKTAKDINARSNITTIETDIDNIESDISELRSLYSVEGSYGIKINTDGSVTRYGDAIGLNNNYIIGDSMAYEGDNDFDSIYPWSDIKLCNIKETPINEEEIFYEGDDEFSRDGSNGNVFVEIPKFYTKRYKDENGNDIILISGIKKSGFYLEPAFVDSVTGKELEKIYVGAYLTSDNGSSLDSYSGSFPMANKSKNYIKTLKGEMYDYVTLQALQKLIMIEFGITNMSTIFGGLSDMVWSSCKAYETITNTNTVIFGGASYINNLIVGSTIGVSDTFGEIQNRTVTAITEVNTNVRQITFDGDPVNAVLEQTYLYSTGQKSGMTDSLDYHTGRCNYIANNTMANQFKYRNIEGLWGNLGEIMDGVTVKELRLYWDNIKTNYNDITKMHKLNYAMPLQNTYSSSPIPLPSQIKIMGLDFRNPCIMAPEVLATWDTTYYGDAFFSIYDETPEGRTVPIDVEYIGISSMAWDGKLQNGLFTLRFWAEASTAEKLYGTRLIKRSFK